MDQRQGGILIFEKNMLQSNFVENPAPARAFGLKRAFLANSALSLILVSPVAAQNLPSGGVVASGGAVISQTGSAMNIVQSTHKAVVNWQSFDISAGSSVKFTLPDSASITLNRVVGDDPSKIFGSLTSNGQIFLLNPNGVLFGATSRINAAGIVASTLSLSDDDFNAGRYVFKKNGSEAAVTNEGEIVVTGYAALLASTVRNEGLISARMGTVALAGGDVLTLDLAGNSLVSVQVDAAVVDQLVENRGMIAAQDGRVIMTLSSERRLVDSAIASKLQQAQAIVVSGNGRTNRIVAGGQIEAASVKIEGGITGRVEASGSVSVQNLSGLGGQIDITGGDLVIADTAKIDASGRSGGGAINIGGGFQGADAGLLNARTTVVAAGASISADALNAGDGGKVVVWSDKATRYAGNISARGGVAGGNGGFAEVSGKQWLDFTGSVDLRAAAGETGTLLLDPYDLTIQATGTDTGVTGTNASATGSILTVSTIRSLLETSNVVVTTGSTGEESGNITVASDISWVTSNDLTLRAANNVVINANILALSGALTLEAGRTADGSSATASGSVSLNAANNIRLLSKGLTVSAVSGIALSGYVESKTLATLTTSATNSNVAASNASNIFSSGVTATSGSSGSINLKGTGNTELKAITAGTGGATIEVAGSVTSTSAFTSQGSASITSSVGSDGNIDLTGAFSVAGNVTLSADKPGFIRINNITRDTMFSTVTGGGAITLTSAANAITLGVSAQAITGQGGDAGQASGLVSISATAVNIATSIVTQGGNVSITSTSGAVTAAAGANITTTAIANTGTTSGSVTVAGAAGVTLNNVTTTGAANDVADGSNAATVNISSSGGNVSVGAITTSGGQPQRDDTPGAGGTGLDNGGNSASITLSTTGANRTILRGNLTAIGGEFSGTSVAAQGLGGNITASGRVTLSEHVTIDTGATTGYIFLLGTVDSESASALKALTLRAGAGNVRLGGGVGQTAALYSLDVTSAVTTDILANLKTDGTTSIGGRTTGVRIATTSKLNIGNVLTQADNTPVVIDTSGGNGEFTLNNGVASPINTELHAPVTFTRGTGAISLNSTLFSRTGEFNNLSFNTASGSGGAVTIVSTIGGGTSGSATALGDISLSSVSNLSFAGSISAKSLVSLGGSGSMALATNGSAVQFYSGASGYQLSSSSGSALSVNMNVTLTQSGAPVSVSATGATTQLTISGTTTTAGGAVTISTKGLLSATQNNSSILTSNGAITLTGLGGIDNQSNQSTSVYNAGSGKIRMFGGGNTITQYALLSTTNADTNGTPAVLITDAGAVNLSTVNINNGTLGLGTLQVGIVDSDVAVAPAQSVSAGGSLTLLHSGLRLRTSQALKLKFTGDETTNSFVITGTDASGNAQSETVSGTSAGSVTSTKTYKTINSVVATNATAANVSVGLAASDKISGAFSQADVFIQTDKIDIANLSISSASSISITSTANKIDTLGDFDVGSSLTVRAVGHTAGMALTGNVTATTIDIATGNGALILGNFNITSTAGNVTLTGLGVTQGVSSNVTSTNQVIIYGYDYNNANNRGIIDLKGNIFAGNTSASSVLIHGGGSSTILGNVTAGTLASRGGLVIGDDSHYNVPSTGHSFWNWFGGSVSQNSGTALKVGQVTLRARDGTTGNITLTNPNNEFRQIDRVVRYGSFSLFDADTEGNNLNKSGRLDEGTTSNAIRIATQGSLNVASNTNGNTVVLEGSSITSDGNINSLAGNLILRARGGNITFSGGTQQSSSNSNTYLIQNSNNVQLGYQVTFGSLQFGSDAVTTAVSASQAVADAGGAVTINGSAAASNVATSSTGNRIVITSAADDSARTFTVTGTDMFGRALTETITGANAAAASGSKYFATVTAVSAGAGAASTVAVGWATENVAGNVTQQNDVDVVALTGKVGGSITLDRSGSSFTSVTNLTAGGALSLRTDNTLTVSGALASTTGALTLMSNNTQTVSSTGSVTAAGNVTMTTTSQGISIAGAVTSTTGTVFIKANTGLTVANTGSVTTTAASKDITLQAAEGGNTNTLSVQGAISATGNAFVQSWGHLDNSGLGTVTATGSVTLESGKNQSTVAQNFRNMTLGAAINAGGTITGAAYGTLTLTGAMTSGGNILLTSGLFYQNPTTFNGQAMNINGAVTSTATAGTVTFHAGGAFSNNAAGLITASGAQGGVAITAGKGVNLVAASSTYDLTLSGNITSGTGGIQFHASKAITQSGASVLTSTGAVSGQSAAGAAGGAATAPAARASVTFNNNNNVASVGPFYVATGIAATPATFTFRNVAGLLLSGDIKTSDGAITLTAVNGALNLAGFGVSAGELATAGSNIVLSGRGITQSGGTISATGSLNGTTPSNGTNGGTILLTGSDGTAAGAITLSGTLATANTTSTAITVRGTTALMLPNVTTAGGLILGDNSFAITGNVTQAQNSVIQTALLNIGTVTTAVGGSVVLANQNKIDTLNLSNVTNVEGTQYDLDIADTTGGLTIAGAQTSTGGIRIATAKSTGAVGTLVIGTHNITASGDIFLGGETISQSSGSSINADGSGVSTMGGTITVSGGGGTNAITLGGTITTDSNSESAIVLRSAANATLNIVSAVAGGVSLGVSGGALSGAVTQSAGTGIISAATLYGNAGSVVATNTRVDNLGAFTTTGALTISDKGGAGGAAAGLTLIGNVTAGAGSQIETTDGELRLVGTTVNAAGVDLVLKGIGVSQTSASKVFATTAQVTGGTGSIDLSSMLNDFTGQVTLTATGAAASIGDINGLSLNSLTGKLAVTTSITAIAGTQLVLTPENLTTTSGNIYFQSKDGNLTTPGTLTTTTGNVTLIGNFVTGSNGTVQVNQTITTGSGAVTVNADKEVILSKSVLSTSGNMTVSGATVTHSTGSLNDILYLRTGSAGSINVTASGTGGLVMGQYFYYEAGTGAINVTSGGTVDLSNMTSSGVLTVSAVGQVQQVGLGSSISVNALSVKTRNNGSISLANMSNNAAYVKLLSRNAADTAAGSGAISYFDTNGMSVSQIQSAGTVTLTSGGVIDTDATNVLGSGLVEATNLTIKTLSNAGAGVILTNASNDIGTLNVSVRNAADTAAAGSTATENTTTGTGGAVRVSDTNGFIVGSLQTGASAVLLAGDAVTQTGAIIVSKLGLSGAGRFTLNLANAQSAPLNQISTFASSATGAVVLTTNTALTIGAVNPTGITTGGALITITAPSINASSTTIDTRSSSNVVTSGVVTLTTTGTGSAGNLVVGNIITTGASAAASSDGQGGNAGNITLTASGSSLTVSGAIGARAGAADGSGAAGIDGTVKLIASAGQVLQANGSGTNAINAGGLLVDAGLAVTLLDTGNNISRLSARVLGTGEEFKFASSNAFAINGGTAANLGWTGLATSGGNITLLATGAATVLENISTRGGSFTAVNLASLGSSSADISTAGDVTYASGAYKAGGAISIQTTGALTTGAVTSAGDTAASSATGNSISLVAGGTLTSGALTSKGAGAAAGNVSLQGALIRMAGNINAGVDQGTSATSGGNVSFTGPVVLTNSDRTITTGVGNGSITFGSTLNSDSAARNLSMTAGTGSISFGGNVGTTAALNSLAVSSANNVTFSGNVAAAGFVQSAGTGTSLFSGTTTLSGAFLFTGNELTINGPLSSTAAMTVVNAGTFTTSADGDLIAAGGLSQTGAGSSRIAGDITTTASNISFATPVVVTGNVAMGSANGNINFVGLLDGDGSATPASLTLGSGTGNVTFSTKVGSLAMLGALGVNTTGLASATDTIQVGSFAINAASTLPAGSATLLANVTTATTQVYNTALNVGANINLTGTQITTGGTVSGGGNFALTITGNAVLGNASDTLDNITGLQALTVTGTTLINTGVITTRGGQTYTGNATLGNATALSTTDNGTVLFSGTVNGAKNLTISTGSGNVTLTGAVGGTTRLGSLTLVSTGATTFGSSVKAASLSASNSGTVFVGGDIDTTGAQGYNGSLVLNADAVLVGTNISFGQMIDSDAALTKRALTVTGSGATTFAGAVGGTTALASLTVNGGGTALLNGSGVTTSGAQSYADVVTVGASTILTGTDISFGQTIDGGVTAGALTVTGSGAKTFTGAIGSTVALASLKVDGGGTALFNGGTVITSGAQSYVDALTLGAATVLTTSNGAVSFGSTLNSAAALVATPATLTITAGTGDVSFAGIVGGAAYTGSDTGALGAVTLVSAKDVTIGAAFKAASLAQSAGTGLTTINGATSLTGALAFTGTGLTVNAAVTAGGAVTVANSGIFTTIA
ncbi:filamentous hemagglutinin N-terminal domain-containing protein, partial [Sandarakinorhabdus limnophila]|uniref:filamentous hemagglutinin N-terminal domain-containing protein n=1 Tax=Sandarakinorhabdus limnophila TaxID=210512 RepID=UPI0003B781DE